jgi:DNA-binding CsgD family transcriptional regulator
MVQALGSADLRGLASLHYYRKIRIGHVMAVPMTCRLARARPDGCLTAREKDVLRWLSAGKTDRDIAAILGISPRTVHKHLQRIYEKLGVETRTAAVARVLSRQAILSIMAGPALPQAPTWPSPRPARTQPA